MKLIQLTKKAFAPIAEDAVPSENPHWPCHELGRHKARKHFALYIEEGLRKTRIEPVKYTKVGQVYQEKEEPPTTAMERLKGAMME